MFMDAGDSHLDFEYDRQMWMENITGHEEAMRLSFIYDKCLLSQLILKFCLILDENSTHDNKKLPKLLS